MSLNFDLTKIANSDAIISNPFDTDKMHPVTNALIWETMAVDLGEITTKNVDEFWWRVQFVQAMCGAELHLGDGTPLFLTRQDVVDHIGLSTNVTDLKRGAFLKRWENHRFQERKDEKSARQVFDAQKV